MKINGTTRGIPKGKNNTYPILREKAAVRHDRPAYRTD
jgi:hypothetical protein